MMTNTLLIFPTGMMDRLDLLLITDLDRSGLLL
jgi:hypothetical protein